MYREAMDKVLDAERLIDVDKLRYGDFNYWPIIRSGIFHNIIQVVRTTPRFASGPVIAPSGTSQAEPSATPELTFIGPPETGLVHFDAEEVQRAFEQGAVNPEVLIFCRHEEMDQRFGNRVFARYLDSLLEVTAEHYRVLKLVDIHPGSFSQSRYHPCLFVHPNYWLETGGHSESAELLHFEEMTSHLVEVGLGKFVGDKTVCLQLLQNLQKCADGFEALLRHVKPKLVICSTYWHPWTRPLMLAAHRRGIPTVDVQHGRLGPDHGSYTQLSKIPDGGYEVMPDYIWCWGPTTRDDIARDRPEARPFHKAIVGGNPWFERWAKTKSELDVGTAIEVLRTEAGGRKMILLSMQPLEVPLTALMLECLKTSPKEWVWLIRAHPRQKQSLDEIAKVLSAHGVAYLDLESTKDLPLYALLELADHQMTYYSSTAVDGLDFGLQTTLLDGPGQEIFRSLIEDGAFQIASSASGVLEAIQTALDASDTRGAASFIAKEPNLSLTTLQSLLAA